MVEFIKSLYAVYRAQHFTYLEINPLVVTDSNIFILDLAAKVKSHYCIDSFSRIRSQYLEKTSTGIEKYL